VKVYLLPDRSKSGKRKTKVKKHTLNPLFEEILKVDIADAAHVILYRK
jgi:synaptotagmin-like protein